MVTATVLIAALSSARADPPPLAVIGGASVRYVKNIAIESAIQHGWNVAGSDQTSATFEIKLDEPATPRPVNMPASARTWLRIRLSFADDEDSVIVTAHAEEIWMVGLAVRRVVTLDRPYRRHLVGMLENLRDRFR